MIAGVQVERALEVIARLREPRRRPLNLAQPAEAHHAGGVRAQAPGVQLPRPVGIPGCVKLSLRPRGPHLGGPRRDVRGALEQRARGSHAGQLAPVAAPAARSPRLPGLHHRPRLQHAVVVRVRSRGGGENLPGAVGVVEPPALQPGAGQRHVRVARVCVSRGGVDIPGFGVIPASLRQLSGRVKHPHVVRVAGLGILEERRRGCDVAGPGRDLRPGAQHDSLRAPE